MLHHSYGQNDKQWLINNSRGKEGLTASGVNYFLNPITGDFTLSGIKHPATGIANARNDIFAIYSDGKHFNSRFQSGRGFFYPDAANISSLGSSVHSFHPGNSGLAYMYLTNRYEEDDPPKLVYARSTGSLNPPIYPLGTTDDYGDGRLIHADHNVVRNKDITLVIDLKSLKELDTIVSDKNSFRLICDSLKSLNSSPHLPNANYFNLQPIFTIGTELKAEFPSGTSANAPGSNIVNLNYNSVSPFAYVNLRPSNLIDGCVPNENIEKYEAVFRIVDENNLIVASLNERILNSYDPNFIKVEHICKAPGPNGIQMVYYYLQFRNTSVDQPATGLKVTLSFPQEFLTNCFQVLGWSPSTNSSANHVDFNGSAIQFTYSSSASLSIYQPQDTLSCSGHIRFKIGVPSTYDLTDPQKSLRLINPLVYFDGIAYPIDDFKDMMFVKDSAWTRVIKEGNCSCGSTFCLPCLAGILAALAIAVILFVRLRRRRRTAPPQP